MAATFGCPERPAALGYEIFALGYETLGRPERPVALGYETFGLPELFSALGYETFGLPADSGTSLAAAEGQKSRTLRLFWASWRLRAAKSLVP